MSKVRNTGGSAAALSVEIVRDVLAPPIPPAKRPLGGQTTKDTARYDQLLRRVEETLRAYQEARRQFQNEIGVADALAFAEDWERSRLRAECPADLLAARDACRAAIIKKQNEFQNANLPSVDIVNTETGRRQVDAQQEKKQKTLAYRTQAIKILANVSASLDHHLDADPDRARDYFQDLGKWALALGLNPPVENE
jgi:hypothetical protein